MKSAKLLLFTAAMLTGVLAVNAPASAQGNYTNIARTCANTSPMNSREWMDFKAFVNREYFSAGGDYSETTYTYAYGHALGRLAQAVEQIPEREKKFDCVKRALEQTISSASLQRFVITKTTPLGEAAMGMHDDEVAFETGVTTSSPLYSFFGTNGSVQTIRPRTRPASPPNSQTGGGSGGSQNGTSIFGTGGNTVGSGSGGTTRYDRDYYGDTTIVTNGALGGTYVNEECTEYANFSLANAFPFMKSASIKGRDFDQRGFTDCYGDGWAICRDILADLTKAQTQVNQIFLDATSGNCRKCNLDAIQGYGHKLYEWEQWLVKRGYSSAWGFAKTFSGAIDDHMNDPKCKIEIPESTTIITKDDGHDWSDMKPAVTVRAPASKPGYYVYKKSGTGYRRKWGSAEYFTGNHITIVKIKPGDTFAGESVQWTANELKSSETACKAPSPPLCPCNIDPDIWKGRPQYTMIEGPFDTETEAANSFSCAKPIYRGSRSIKTCSYWKKQERPSKDIKKVCP